MKWVKGEKARELNEPKWRCYDNWFLIVSVSGGNLQSHQYSVWGSIQHWIRNKDEFVASFITIGGHISVYDLMSKRGNDMDKSKSQYF